MTQELVQSVDRLVERLMRASLEEELRRLDVATTSEIGPGYWPKWVGASETRAADELRFGEMVERKRSILRELKWLA